MTSASNVVFECVVESQTSPGTGPRSTRCVYKPVAGEQPLWDFPGSVLARHEVAAGEICRLLGYEYVPLAVWRDDAPAGPGVLVEWVDADVTADVGVFAVGSLPTAWLPVLQGTDEHDQEVVVAHRDTQELADIAVLDVIINNSDRKVGHLLGDGSAIRAIDHGVAFHPEWKLRTVLWGFAGRSLSPAQRNAVARVAASVADPAELARLAPHVQELGEAARTGIVTRCENLLHSGVFPSPRPGWPVVPWPLW